MKTKTRKQKKTKASVKLENKTKCKILLLNKDIRKTFFKNIVLCKKKKEREKNEGGAELFPAFY